MTDTRRPTSHAKARGPYPPRSTDYHQPGSRTDHDHPVVVGACAVKSADPGRLLALLHEQTPGNVGGADEQDEHDKRGVVERDRIVPGRE